MEDDDEIHGEGDLLEGKNAKQETEIAITPEMRYGVVDAPPWYLCITFGMQHYLMMLGSTLSIPYVLSTAMCVDNSLVIVSELISTILFVSGLATLLQTTIGVRLPIVQGGTASLLVPTLAILNIEKWKCTPDEDLLPTCNANMTLWNDSSTNCRDDPDGWKLRMREVQGGVIMASIFQMLIGFSGLLGVLLQYIGPLVVAPTVSLIGISMFEPAAEYASKQWWVAFMSMALTTLFAMYLRNIHIPRCSKSRTKEGSTSSDGFPLFQLFPVMLSIMCSWIVCAILTFTNVFPSDVHGWGYSARVDMRAQVMVDAAWFRVPYPGQWGMPTVTASSAVGMIAGVLASVVESVGDYYACARMSAAPPPPGHAVMRGIGVEGLGSLLAGLIGSGNGTTSYSDNIGAIGITKVASRRVIQAAAIIMIVLAMFGKFGAIFTTIPEPIIGGLFFAMYGMIAAVGISNLQFVDLNSTRNLYIFGCSIFLGLSLPQWLKNHPESINTGVLEIDNVLLVLGTTMMFVGGATGFILDNTIPGTPEERGVTAWRETSKKSSYVCDVTCYDLPFGMASISKWRWTKYLPFCPTFKGFENITVCRKTKKKSAIV